MPTLRYVLDASAVVVVGLDVVNYIGAAGLDSPRGVGALPS